MKAEREKINAKVKADTVRLNGSKLELTADEEMCTFLLVSEGSCTLQMGENESAAEPRQCAAAGRGERGALCRRCSRPGTGGLPVPAQRPARAAQRRPAGFCPAVFARGGDGAVRPGAVDPPPAHPAGDDALCHAGAGLPRRAVPAADPALCRAGVPCREQRRGAPPQRDR